MTIGFIYLLTVCFRMLCFLFEKWQCDKNTGVIISAGKHEARVVAGWETCSDGKIVSYWYVVCLW